MIDTHDLKLQVKYKHHNKHNKVIHTGNTDTRMVNESTVTVTVRSQAGQEVNKREYPFRSFTKNILPFLSTRLSGGPNTTDIAVPTQNDQDDVMYGNVTIDDVTQFQYGSITSFGDTSTLTNGIVIGSGNSTVTPNDISLDNILTTSGIGKGTDIVSSIMYDIVTKASYFTITNTFINSTPNTFSVQEAGLYMDVYIDNVLSNSKNFMYARDVFDVPFVVPVNNTITIEYKIAFAATDNLGFSHNFVKLFHAGMKGDMDGEGSTVDITDLSGTVSPVVAFDYTNQNHTTPFNHFNISGADGQDDGGIRAYSGELVPLEFAVNDYATDPSNYLIAKTVVENATPHVDVLYNFNRNNISVSDMLTNISGAPVDIEFITISTVDNHILMYYNPDTTIALSDGEFISVEFKLTIS